MKKFEYKNIDQSNLLGVEPGTYQTPVLMNLLNGLGDEGWRVVHFSGDHEGDFFCLLMREVSRGS